MQLCVGSLLILATLTWAQTIQVATLLGHSAFDYIQRYGIPIAEQIRKSEKRRNNSKIVGGVPATAGQYPFQAGLIGDVMGLDSYTVCGGSLVTPSRVLTAAHCWNDGKSQVWRFTIVLGSVLLFSEGTRIQSSAVASHPHWSPALVHNDVAVIYLPNPVTLTSVIGAVALPSGSQIDENFAGESAIAVGFGITSDDGGISQNQSLNHVRLNIISNNMCFLAYPLFLQPFHLCTSGFGGVSICSGDSGGPLLITRDGKNILVGISSFVSGFGCKSNLPAAFSRITFYMDFIGYHL